MIDTMHLKVLMETIRKSIMSKNLKEVLTIGRYFKNKFGEKVYKFQYLYRVLHVQIQMEQKQKEAALFVKMTLLAQIYKRKKTKFKLNPNIEHNPFLENQLKQLEMQFIATKKGQKINLKQKNFIVYFQSFTNTYAPLSTLKSLYEKALSFDDVIGLSIGTRTVLCDR